MNQSFSDEREIGRIDAVRGMVDPYPGCSLANLGQLVSPKRSQEIEGPSLVLLRIRLRPHCLGSRPALGGVTECGRVGTGIDPGFTPTRQNDSRFPDLYLLRRYVCESWILIKGPDGSSPGQGQQDL